MSLADLAPYITAVIAVLGTLFGAALAGVFGLLQARRAQEHARKDTWVKGFDEQRRAIWQERRIIYSRFLRESELMSVLMCTFDCSGLAADECDEPYKARLEELSNRWDAYGAVYWEIDVLAETEVRKLCVAHYQKQADAVDQILNLRRYDRDWLWEDVGEIAAAMRRSLIGMKSMPEAMQEVVREFKTSRPVVKRAD